MCYIFKIAYAYWHSDDIKAPCEWRDEGILGMMGRRMPCEKSSKYLTDLGRLCLACCRHGQDLVDLSTSCQGNQLDSYAAQDGKAVMVIIIRNDSHFRKSAHGSRISSAAPNSLGFPTPSEVHFKCSVNEEFLARRLKHRYLQHRFDNRGYYQDFLEASPTHFDAQAALNSSIFNVQSSALAISSTENWQKAATQTGRIQTINSFTQTHEIKNLVTFSIRPSLRSSSESDDFSISDNLSDADDFSDSNGSTQSDNCSLTIHLPLYQAPNLSPSTASSESHNSKIWYTSPQPQTRVHNLKSRSYEARKASLLQIPSTTADLDSSDSNSEAKDEMVAPLSSPPASPTLRYSAMSQQFSILAYSSSQSVPMSPCDSTLSNPLKSSIVSTTSYFSLNDNDPSDELPDALLCIPSLEEFECSEVSEDSISDSSNSSSLFGFEDSFPLASSDSECGQRMLFNIRQLLAMPDSKTPQEVSEYIEHHPALMSAIRSGRLPVRQYPTFLSKKTASRRIAHDPFDGQYAVQAKRDHRRFFMQARFETAIRMLDWAEIDDAPIPFTNSFSLRNVQHAGDEKYRPCDEDDSEKCAYVEEYNNCVYTTVSPTPNRLTKLDSKCLIKQQVKRSSPLRRMLTMREAGDEVVETEDEQAEEAANPFEQEVWVDVDLNVIDYNVSER